MERQPDGIYQRTPSSGKSGGQDEDQTCPRPRYLRHDVVRSYTFADWIPHRFLRPAGLLKGGQRQHVILDERSTPLRFELGSASYFVGKSPIHKSRKRQYGVLRSISYNAPGFPVFNNGHPISRTPPVIYIARKGKPKILAPP
jgi:hypothetical protein